MTLNEFKNYMKGYKDAFDSQPKDADCRKMLERMFELLETVIETAGITVYTDKLYPAEPFEPFRMPAVTYGYTTKNGEIIC